MFFPKYQYARADVIGACPSIQQDVDFAERSHSQSISYLCTNSPWLFKLPVCTHVLAVKSYQHALLYSRAVQCCTVLS